ncbi:MAG: hypothetical protein ABF876_16690 [Acetobacter aceti]|uniref:CdiA toxin EC869-like domain-containing protein n=1 Tax=Acetobacter aceti TaxID=435 RepID=A0A1U9KE93_ACEAC|nr:hypothetical protein [Acetobacter aceti]AQS84134.1 hypothetical protein A0U92_04400 [Acetobacter aceti]
MTFDHWNQDSGNAVSDKVLNTQRASFLATPAEIKYRIWADLKEMAMRYTEDASRRGTAERVAFTQEYIESYTFELGVRADGTTKAQWEQICQAYHGAAAKMADYERNGDKPLTFEIDAITNPITNTTS